jgi:hypothetical protein
MTYPVITEDIHSISHRNIFDKNLADIKAMADIKNLGSSNLLQDGPRQIYHSRNLIGINT